MLKIYEYSKCSTCVKALKFLDSKKVKYDKVPIVETAPSQNELKEMLTAVKNQGGGIKNLFNTSGVLYKELQLSKKLPSLSETEAIKLLSENGRLVKRPFVIGKGIHIVGFKQEDWDKVF